MQAQIIILVSVTLLLVTLVVGTITVSTQNELLLRRVDEELQVSMRMTSGEASKEPGRPFPPEGEGPGRARIGSLDVVIGPAGVQEARVVTAAGEIQNLEESEVLKLVAAAEAGAPGEAFDADLGALGAYRVLFRSVPSAGGETLVAVGQSLEEVRSTTRSLILVFTAAALFGVGAGSLGVSYLLRRTMRPVAELQKVAAEISETPLAKGEVNLPTRTASDFAGAGAEVADLAASFNTMLDHVEDALQRREEGEAKLKQFAADASHELRTPLASIAGYAEYASRYGSDLPPEVGHSLGRIRSEGARMGGIVENLLLLARLDAGHSDCAGDTAAARVVVEALADAKAAGPEHIWSADLAPDAETLHVRVSEPSLRQVVSNLLTNARIHTPPGTRVTVALTKAEGMVLIQVLDNGPGIPKELADKVFDRFVRADPARTATGGDTAAPRSTGLGLAIVEQIARSCGGRVDLQTSPGATTFSVYLPQSPSEER